MRERTSIPAAPPYTEHNDADRWPEHALRVDVTVDVAAARFADWPDVEVVLDPAAGAGRTARELAAELDAAHVTGDLAPDAPVDHPGRDAADLLTDIAALDHRADIVILGEVLEHVEHPEVLIAASWAALRPGGGLVISTPLDEPDGVNPEHLWRWDRAGVVELLTAANLFEPLDYVELDTLVIGYGRVRTQIHTARRTP